MHSYVQLILDSPSGGLSWQRAGSTCTPGPGRLAVPQTPPFCGISCTANTGDTAGARVVVASGGHTRYYCRQAGFTVHHCPMVSAHWMLPSPAICADQVYGSCQHWYIPQRPTYNLHTCLATQHCSLACYTLLPVSSCH